MLPAFARAFDTSVARAAVVVTATSVAYGICQLLFGPLGDRFGKFRVIAWACLASTLGATACALAPTLGALSLARGLTGATTAALIPLSMAWIGDVVAFDQRQPTLAKFMSGQIIGLVSGQALGGLFADTVGWRWGFAFLAAIYLVVGLLLLRAMKHLRKSAIHAATDSPGAFAGIALVLGSASARWILGTVFLEAMTTFGVIAFIPAHLHEHFGISLFHAGAVVAVFGLGGLLYTAQARRWVRALGNVRLARSGGLLLSLAFVILSLAISWHLAILASLVAGLGFYQLHNTLQTQATQMAPAARGTAVSIFAACFFLGQAVGVSLGALVVEHLGALRLFAVSALVLPVIGWVFSSHLRRQARADRAAS